MSFPLLLFEPSVEEPNFMDEDTNIWVHTRLVAPLMFYFNKLLLLSDSRKVLGLIPRWAGSFLCGVLYEIDSMTVSVLQHNVFIIYFNTNIITVF